MSRRKLAPLRRIVDVVRRENGLTYEVLECGHEQTVKEDIYGPTNAERRRCRRCGRAALGEDRT